MPSPKVIASVAAATDDLVEPSCTNRNVQTSQADSAKQAAHLPLSEQQSSLGRQCELFLSRHVRECQQLQLCHATLQLCRVTAEVCVLVHGQASQISQLSDHLLQLVVLLA